MAVPRRANDSEPTFPRKHPPAARARKPAHIVAAYPQHCRVGEHELEKSSRRHPQKIPDRAHKRQHQQETRAEQPERRAQTPKSLPFAIVPCLPVGFERHDLLFAAKKPSSILTTTSQFASIISRAYLAHSTTAAIRPPKPWSGGLVSGRRLMRCRGCADKTAGCVGNPCGGVRIRDKSGLHEPSCPTGRVSQDHPSSFRTLFFCRRYFCVRVCRCRFRAEFPSDRARRNRITAKFSGS